MGILLYEHNQEAYESAERLLAETGRAAVIHPTGTGKSFIGFKLCEQHPESRICWISPSEYIFRTQVENLKKVCGEETAGEILANVQFLTYARLAQMKEEEISALDPDFIILDEFHRCGAPVWGQAVERYLQLYSSVPVLGLSATNVRYLDNQRDMAEELFNGNIASEMTLGEAIVRRILDAPKYVMTAFLYNTELDRLEKRLDHVQNKAARDAGEKYYEALRRALDKADGLDVIFEKHMEKPKGKYLVFTSNLKAMKECLSHVSEWFSKVDPDPHVYTLYSPDPKTLKSFDAFKADTDDSHLRLLFCIDALNEGIHIDDVDGVILFRPTSSPTIYKQQIGRALSAGKAETPVIFDIVNNFEGLYSIGSLQEEMRCAIEYYREAGEAEKIVTEQFRVIDEVKDCRKLFNQMEEALTASWDAMYLLAARYYKEHGDLNVPIRYQAPGGYSLGRWLQVQRRIRSGKIAGELSEERERKLDAIGMRWESASDLSWEKHLDSCRKYRQEHGNLNVPGDYVDADGVRLGEWLKSIRSYKRYGIRSAYFTPEREKLLDDLGMVWNQSDYLWERNYAAAKSYFQQYGNLDVPPGHMENGINLYNWLSDLRKMYRCCRLKEDTAEAKTTYSVGTDPNVSADAVSGCKGTGDHREERSVPTPEGESGAVQGTFSEGESKNQRRTLTESQIAQLDAIGMRWEAKTDVVWNTGYTKAGEYFKEHGSIDVPVNYVTSDGYKLGVWLSKAREKYAKGVLSREQIEQLEAFGMVWDKSRKNDWEDCYRKALAYYQEYGNLFIPSNYIVDGIWLGKWVNEQRQILAGNRQGKTLTNEQKEKLSSIGLTAEKPAEERWKRR